MSATMAAATPQLAHTLDPTTRSPAPQHLSALARANEIRLARATLKREIASGERTVADVLLQIPTEIERMEIGELLCCQRRWGAQRTRRLLATIPVIETKLVGTLTQRQRTALAEALGGTPAATSSLRVL